MYIVQTQKEQASSLFCYKFLNLLSVIHSLSLLNKQTTKSYYNCTLLPSLSLPQYLHYFTTVYSLQTPQQQILSMLKQLLDYTLVPSGLLLMVAYHLWLLHQIVKHPTKTVIGVNAINRRFWVRAMMEDTSKNGVLAVQTLRNNIMASTLLASTAIMLSSLIAVLMTSGSGDRSMWLVFGDRSELFFSIKFFLILVCFLVAFLLIVQSIRYYSHASILINVPFKKISRNVYHHQRTAEYVARTVNRGSYFWSLGLRAFYFSFPLFLWIFGPIPMFLCCFLLVFMLYFLDIAFEFGSSVGVSDNDIDHDHVDEELGTYL